MHHVKNYNQLNNSFKKTLVFKIGDEAGFFSEYNNMILCMLYCLENNIKFVLSSKNANFAHSKGWTDFFEPFCTENNSAFHLKYNHRSEHSFTPLIRHRLKRLGLVTKVETNYPWYFKVLKKLRLAPYLTQDLFFNARKLDTTKTYNFPTLQINGNLRAACKQLTELTWKFNTETSQNINKRISGLNLPTEYVGLHIRRGDKDMEHEALSYEKYFVEIQKRTSIKNTFVLTDDYTVIEQLQANYPEWNISTFCEKSERGYFHSDFLKQSSDFKKQKMIVLFASIQTLLRSQLFVGTYSSNPGMFIGMKMLPEQCIGIDFDEWIVW